MKTTAMPAPAQASWGNALSFDGVDDHVVVPAGPWCANEFPVETRIYPRSAAGRAGKLLRILAGWGVNDRDPPGAMRPGRECLERKSFSLLFMGSSAELFTEVCGELPRALLALG